MMSAMICFHYRAAVWAMVWDPGVWHTVTIPERGTNREHPKTTLRALDCIPNFLPAPMSHRRNVGGWNFRNFRCDTVCNARMSANYATVGQSVFFGFPNRRFPIYVVSHIIPPYQTNFFGGLGIS